MSPAGNNNGLNSAELDKTIDDTVPTNPIELPSSEDIQNSPQYINFIEAINKIQGNNVSENPYAYIEAIGMLIKSQVVALFKEADPEYFEVFNSKYKKNGAFAKAFNRITAGHDGIDQLGGVIISMCLNQNKDFFRNPEVFEIISSIVNQHICEVISDNLNESKLLSIDILNNFVTVLQSSGKDVKSALKKARMDFFTELQRKPLSAIFKVKAQKILEGGVKLLIRKDLYEKLVPTLLYLNLYASKKAYDTLAKDSYQEGFIGDVSRAGMQALPDRYISQIELITRKNLPFAEKLAIRTKEILTNYTFAAMIKALFIGDPNFRNQVLHLDYMSEIFPFVENAGLHIRLTNDLGGLASKNQSDINQEFRKLKLQASSNRIKPVAEIKVDFLRLLQDQDSKTKQLFYAYIKDLSTGEENSALDNAAQGETNIVQFLERLEAATVSLALTAQQKFGTLAYAPVGIELVTQAFARFCEILYQGANDFDTAGAKKVIEDIINQINIEQNPKVVQSQQYVEA